MKSSNWIGMALAGCLMLGGIAAQAGVDEEFAFASGLVSYSPSFPDFAQKVVDAVLAKDPTQKDRSKIIQAEILIQRRQFADAEALIAEMGIANPKSQAISLALARNYFAIGEMDKSKKLYEDFFKQYAQMPTDPDVARFYRDAAYQFAQMQSMAGDYEGAAASYQRVETVAEGNEQKRALQVSRAQALVKAAEKKSGDEKNKLLDDAKKVCETLQWGGLDLQFVDSIVIMANIELAKGNPAGAQKVLMDYMDIIKPIDDTLAQLGLPMRESPMAGARSLLGRLMKEAADKLDADKKADEAIKAYSGALGEYYNVFVKYGDSDWGPSAGMAAKEIKGILETRYGKTVKIDLPDTLATKAAGTEFMMADNLFRQKKYAEAAAEYLRVLSQFPEAAELSVGALGNLVQCYMNLNDSLYAKVVANYLGERFAAKSDIPAKALISVAQLYDKAGNADMAKYMFDRYLAYCPADPRAGQILFYLASKAETAGRQDEANAYLAKIITDYQGDQNYPKALSKRAWKAYGDKDYAGAIDGMKLFIEQSQPSPTKAQAMFALGDCYRRTDKLADAVRQFNALIAAIAPEGNPYANSQADKDRNAKLLEQTRFYFAYSLSRLPTDATRKAAIAKLDEFLGFYPKSDLAAKSLNLKGSLQMALKDVAANETFARLAAEYPETDEGKNAQYARINGALELGQFDQAREALAAMLANPGSYKVDEFARVGQAMLDKEQWQEAANAFGRVTSQTEERALLERALYGTGAAKYELGDHAGAVAALNELMVKWPNSALFYQAKFMLARANMALNDLASAKTALNDVFKFAREPEVVNDAKLLYGQILRQQGDQTGALGAFKGLEYFGSQAMKTERERQQVAEAILAAIDLGAEMDKNADVLESCDMYLKLYPTGPKVAEVRQKRTAASFKVNADAAPAPAPAPAAAAPAPAQ